MPYRETTAWLTLAAMAIGYGPFFVVLGQSEAPDLFQFLIWFAAASVVRILIECGGRIFLALKHGPQPPDERDRAIAQRSTTFGYYVLLVGMILVGVVMPFGSQALEIASAGLFFIVVAELIRNLAIALSYRLGWQ